MSELYRETLGGFGPQPFGDSGESGDGETRLASVEVVHGVYAHSLPLAGMTVGQARAELADRMNIDPAATAVVDGVPADEDAVLAENSTLTFARPAGEKG